MRLVIVTGIPVQEFWGHLYVDDRWAEDVKGQVGIWDAVEVFCPLARLEVVPHGVVPVPETVEFRAYADLKELLGQLVSRLRSDRRGGTAYEFAGTNRVGRIGFSLARLVGGRHAPLFITFDAPLSMIGLRGGSFARRAARTAYVLFLRLFRRWALRSARGVMSVGEGVLDEIDPGKRYREKCLVIPLTLFSEADLVNPELKDHSTDRPLRIVCADRLSSEKGVFELVRAFDAAEDQLSEVELVLFGDGPQRSEISEYVGARPRLKGRVGMRGAVPHGQLLAELRVADVLVNLTKVGDLNRTVWEGAACGCAVIASDLPGVRTFFVNEENALLVSPDDVEGIATALVRICHEHALRVRLAIGAYELARENTNRQTKMRRREWIQSMIETGGRGVRPRGLRATRHA